MELNERGVNVYAFDGRQTFSMRWQMNERRNRFRLSFVLAEYSKFLYRLLYRENIDASHLAHASVSQQTTSVYHMWRMDGMGKPAHSTGGTHLPSADLFPSTRRILFLHARARTTWHQAGCLKQLCSRAQG